MFEYFIWTVLIMCTIYTIIIPNTSKGNPAVKNINIVVILTSVPVRFATERRVLGRSYTILY